MDPMPLPTGVGVALVTHFGDDGRPDVARTAAHARRCAALGVSAVLVAGTTGEASRLAVEDRLALAAAVKTSSPDVAVLVGTGRPSAAGTIETSAKVAAGGAADALLVYCPPEADPAELFGRVRDEVGDLAVLAYHNPALEARALAPELLASLPVDGVKDSSASTTRVAELIELGVRVYVGSPTQLALAGPCGAAGALLALANIVPTLCIAAWRGDTDAQRTLFGVQRRALGRIPQYLKAAEPR